MTKQMEQALQSLISEALAHANDALDAGDLATAEFFKKEAFAMLAKLPENNVYTKTLQ